MVYVILLSASGFLVAYSCALDPLLLMVGARFIRDHENSPKATESPVVSVAVAAHDEETVIEAKIRNTQAFDYPKERYLVGLQRGTWQRVQR
jgi:hypothetical protein